MTTEIETALRRLTEQSEAELASRLESSFLSARRNMFRLLRGSVLNMNTFIRELRIEIISRTRSLSPAGDEPFTAQLVVQLADEVKRAISFFTERASGAVARSLENAFDLGSSVGPSAFRSIGVPVAAPGISPALLSNAAAATDSILIEAGEALRQTIMREIRFAAASLQPASQALRRIEELLRVSGEVAAGQRQRIGFSFQAESIVRTEVGRVYSSAQQATSEVMAETIPRLKKRWVVSGRNNRRGHREVQRRYAPGGDIGPIPVSQRFIVRDFTRVGPTVFLTLGKRIKPRSGSVSGLRVIRTDRFSRKGKIITDRMLFPRDPRGSAGNVVNCACVVVETTPEIESAVERTLGRIAAG